MDIYVLVFLLVVLWGIKIEYSSEMKVADYFSVSACNMLKGMFALCVVFHHLAENTSSGIIFSKFYFMGDLSVAVFFFISGYGLIKKLLNDESYLEHFVGVRIRVVVLPYIIVIGIYWILSFATGDNYSLTYVLNSFVNGSPIALYSWYIIVCLLMYAVFFVSASVFRNQQKHELFIIASEVVFCVIWMFVCRKQGFGKHWYATNYVLVVGMLWSVYEKQILSFLSDKKIFFGALAVCAFAFAILFAENIYLQKDVISSFTTSMFALIVVQVCMIFKLNSAVLAFLGTISKEIYLIHGAFVALFRSDIINIDSDFIYSGLVIVSSIVTSFLLYLLFSAFKGKKKAVQI